MKFIYSSCLAAVLLVAYNFAIADTNNIELNVETSIITQIQSGDNNVQDLKIGYVGVDLGLIDPGELTINVVDTDVVQEQSGSNNVQTALVGIIGCIDC